MATLVLPHFLSGALWGIYLCLVLFFTLLVDKPQVPSDYLSFRSSRYVVRFLQSLDSLMTPTMQQEPHTLQLLFSEDNSCKEELALNGRIGALVFKVRMRLMVRA